MKLILCVKKKQSSLNIFLESTDTRCLRDVVLRLDNRIFLIRCFKDIGNFCIEISIRELGENFKSFFQAFVTFLTFALTCKVVNNFR